MIRLRIEGEEPEFRTFRKGPVVIGRDPGCDLALPDVRGLSRHHCRLSFEGGGCAVEDLGSRNKTVLNGEPVGHAPLRPGDRLQLGQLHLRVEAFSAEEEQTEAMLQRCLHCGQDYARRLDACPHCRTPARQGRSRTIGAHTFRGYRLIRRLGSGGMGIVFEAEDLVGPLGRVALKVLRPHLAHDRSYLVRFVEEIRALTSLRHDAIVAVHGHGQEGDLSYLIMEYVPGSSARDAMIAAGGRLPWRRAVEVAQGAARGLLAAYEQAGIIHGDVKPGNFLLPPGKVKLCDFGLARRKFDRQAESSDDASEAERRGTAAYAAPERFQGPPTLAADVYALGVALFQMVTGHLPFRFRRVAELRRAHEEEPLPSIFSDAPDALPALQPLIERMMAKEARARHRDHHALLNDLATILGS
jgi:serine/threonine protein kinase